LLKIIRFHRYWFGGSSAAVHNFYNCPFYRLFIREVLRRLLQKDFEYAERFLKEARMTLASFQKWQALCPGCSQEHSSLEACLGDFKLLIMAPAGFQKLLVQLKKSLLSNRSKEFDLAGFHKFWAN
jgi:hypothetical protein